MLTFLSVYFPVASSFFVEGLLFVTLPFLLGLPIFLPQDDLLFNSVTRKKKIFFLVLRLTQGILFFCILIEGLYLLFSAAPFQILSHNGNFFFRHDLLSSLINFFLTLLTLYYTYLVAFVFSRTTKFIKYSHEIPFLIVCTLLCLRLFIAANDLILLVILLEISAFCSIIFIGIQSVSSTDYSLSIEATLKYFIINALAVSLLLLSICGYFYVTTSTNLNDIVFFFYKYPFLCIFFTEQLILLQVAFFFAYLIKLGAAPVHQWVPDVYEGAETLVTAFLVLLISPALMFKLGIFFKLLTGVPVSITIVYHLFLVTGLLSIVFGTLGAFYQTRIKRFIAYSALTHLGFMLLGCCFNTTLGYFSFFFYLIIYIFTNICFFTFLLICQMQVDTQARLIYFNQLKLSIQTSFFLFLCLVICLFSFAGVPPFAGFFAKFFILSVLVEQNRFYLVLFLVIAILIGTFMYLRFLKISLFESNRFLDAQTWEITLKSSFRLFPRTLVAVFADYQLRLKLQNVVYNIQTFDTWQLVIFSGLLWVLGFIFLFVIFLAPYSLGILELVTVLLTQY